MRYSALIRTKNSAETLPETLRRLKAQTIPPAEIIVVDSGSTDDSLAIAQANSCRIVPYETGGKFNYSKALNLGVEAAMEDCLLVISSHVWLPSCDTLEWMGKLLLTFSPVAVYCPLEGKDPFQEKVPPRFETVDRSNFNGMNGISNCCALYRTADCRERPFDEAIPTAEDQLWAAQAFLQGAASICLKSHRLIYCNRHSDTQKTIREHTVVHRHVLPADTLGLRRRKLLLSVPYWLLRRRYRTARINLAVWWRLLR